MSAIPTDKTKAAGSEQVAFEGQQLPEARVMSNVAILYASGFTKNTEKVARYMASKVDADVFDLKGISIVDLKEYKTIVFGTGIHAGKPYKPVVSFIQNNRAQFEGKDVKLFICCMYNDDKGKNQCSRVSKELGIPDAAFFNKKEDSMNDEGLPSSVDAFISRIRCRRYTCS